LAPRLSSVAGQNDGDEDDDEQRSDAKIGILAATLIAAGLGALALRLAHRTNGEPNPAP